MLKNKNLDKPLPASDFRFEEVEKAKSLGQLDGTLGYDASEV